jgi:hypothetical protein
MDPDPTFHFDTAPDPIVRISKAQLNLSYPYTSLVFVLASYFRTVRSRIYYKFSTVNGLNPDPGLGRRFRTRILLNGPHGIQICNTGSRSITFNSTGYCSRPQDKFLISKIFTIPYGTVLAKTFPICISRLNLNTDNRVACYNIQYCRYNISTTLGCCEQI